MPLIIGNMSENIKVVYVTGCLGFIGAYVTRACLNKGWYVIGVDKSTYAARRENFKEFDSYGERFKFIAADIKDLKYLHDCDYVINTAAETHVDNSIVDSSAFSSSNIEGVRNLLELIRHKGQYKMPTFFQFSTDEVYGDIAEGSHTENHVLKPSNPYSATKAAADMLILAWNRTYKVPYVILRPTNNYGIGQHPEKLIPKACKHIQLGRKIPVFNGGSSTRMWLHAQDTAAAVITIIESSMTNEIYNVSSNFELSIREVIRKIVGFMTDDEDMDLYCDFSFSRAGHDLRYSLDDSKLRKLGWTNKCDFNSELSVVVNFYNDNFIW